MMYIILISVIVMLVLIAAVIILIAVARGVIAENQRLKRENMQYSIEIANNNKLIQKYAEISERYKHEEATADNLNTMFQ